MKKTIKAKILGMILSVCMVLSMLPTLAFASETEIVEETPTEVVTEKTDYEKCVDLFAALPSVEDITEENKAEIYSKAEQAMNTYMALTEEEQAKFEEEHIDLMMLAMSINDAVTGNSAVTLEAQTPTEVAKYFDGTTEYTIYSDGSDNNSNTNWTELTTTILTSNDYNLPVGNYYLNGDVTVANGKFIGIKEGTTNLCLNGHTIVGEKKSNQARTSSIIAITNNNAILNLYDERDNSGKIASGKEGIRISSGTLNMYGGTITRNILQGYHNGGGGVVNSGTFNMYGGTITGNSATYGSGVYNNYGGSFNMYGGTINRNDSTYGGGVSNHYDGSFNMYGGTITGNSATYGSGVYNDGKFNISGNVQIIGNMKGSNVYLPYNDRIIAIADGGLTDDAKIGVFKKPYPTSGNPITITGNNGADYSSHFTSDITSFEVYNDNNTVKLRVKPESTVPTITINRTLPEGTVDEVYETTLTATGYPVPTWSKESGNLPDGLTLSDDGKISGTPTQNGVFTFVVKATNTKGSETAQFTITINRNNQNINSYTITFNANGGSDVAQQTIEENQNATEPTAPTKEGYTFDGWYKEAGCTNKWNFDTDTVNANITLYAKWEDENITIVNTAKSKVENASYPTPTNESDYADEKALANYVKGIAETAVNDSTITVTVSKVSYTPPVNGTSDAPNGTNGSYKFIITVSKGNQTATTKEITIAISAKAYQTLEVKEKVETPEKPIEKPQSPQTGDDSNPWVYLMFALLSFSGIGYIGYKKKYQK